MVTKKMLFEDSKGRILMPEEVDELSSWELDDRNIHVFEGERF